jgi:outer membrane protein TolC
MRIPRTITQSLRPASWRENKSAAEWLSTSVVHDLRNPLGAIFAAAEMLIEVDAGPVQVKRLATNIHRAAGRMRELLADLNSAARGNRPAAEICNIGLVIGAASEAASATTKNHDVEILLEVSERIELPLIRSRMERVFFNLIANALEAMPAGGKLHIACRKANRYVLVELEDTGPGIPPGIRDQLFEPFVTAGKQDGLGLGLAVSRRIVLDHGGDIWTEPAAGARFVVRLPLRRAGSRIRLIGGLLLLLAAGSGARAQTASPPLLTVDEAVAAAMQGNRRVQSSILDVSRAREGTAAVKTERLPHFQLYALGGEALNSINFTIPQGGLGTYPGTGPIPAQNAKISTPQTFTGLVFGQATQPLSQLWKVHLAVLESKIGEELAQESLRRQRQDTAHTVRDLYYQIAQTQTQVSSAEANVKYLVDLQAETDRNLAEQTALKGDSLAVKAKLSQQRYQLLTLRDSLETQKEWLNQLLGRELNTEFSVEVQPVPAGVEVDIAAARQEALSQRAEVREARLQTKRAEVEVRRERAEYIPDISAGITDLSLPNVSFLPQNVVQAGFLLQWQPFDWGLKRHKIESLKDSVKQTTLTEHDAEQQVMVDVKAKFRKLAEARALLDTSTLAQESEREKMRVVTNRYGQKAALLSDVLQQEAAVAQVDADYRKALAAFWSAKASFDYALGRN